MLGCFLDFKIAFKSHHQYYSLKVPRLKDPRLNILRYQGSVLYWKKNYIKPQQFLDQFLQVHDFHLNEFHLSQQPYQIREVLLLFKIDYCLQQIFHLDFRNIYFFFKKRDTKIYLFCMTYAILLTPIL